MSDFDGFCRIHESNGFQVVWKGEDGAKLLHNLKDCSPDVILLAWDAPGVGASLVEELAASGTRAPIVIISRPEVHDDLVPVMEAGAAGCLSANLDTPDFLAAPTMLAHGDIVVSHDMVPAATGAVDPERPERGLTPRELEILRALGRGATNQEIADQLHLSPHTVKIHVHHILKKMGFRDRQQATAYAASEDTL